MSDKNVADINSPNRRLTWNLSTQFQSVLKDWICLKNMNILRIGFTPIYFFQVSNVLFWQVVPIVSLFRLVKTLCRSHEKRQQHITQTSTLNWPDILPTLLDLGTNCLTPLPVSSACRLKHMLRILECQALGVNNLGHRRNVLVLLFHHLGNSSLWCLIEW